MNIDRYRKLLRVERDGGASPGERDNARRLRLRMEQQHPGIRQAAVQAEAQERVDAEAPRGGGGPTTDGPGPYDTGYYGPPKARPTYEAPGWGDRIRTFVQAAVDEVGVAFHLTDLIRQDVEIDVQANRRTLHVHVRIPIDGLERAADFTGGSLQEYARLIGVQVGGRLSDALRRRGY